MMHYTILYLIFQNCVDARTLCTKTKDSATFENLLTWNDYSAIFFFFFYLWTSYNTVGEWRVLNSSLWVMTGERKLYAYDFNSSHHLVNWNLIYFIRPIKIICRGTHFSSACWPKPGASACSFSFVAFQKQKSLRVSVSEWEGSRFTTYTVAHKNSHWLREGDINLQGASADFLLTFSVSCESVIKTAVCGC